VLLPRLTIAIPKPVGIRLVIPPLILDPKKAIVAGQPSDIPTSIPECPLIAPAALFAADHTAKEKERFS
jgi:hypothetical protein